VYLQSAPSSGTTWTDSSGNGYNGTASGTITRNVAGLSGVGTAYQFSGGVSPTSNYVSTVDNAAFKTTNLTIEAIIKLTVATGSDKQIFSKSDFGSNQQWQFRVNSTGKIELILFFNGQNAVTLSGSTTLVAGTIYHVAGTYDGSNMRVFLNGVQDGIVARTGTPTYTTSRIYMAGTYDPMNGVIDEVAYYGTALSQATILSHSRAAGI
jgi:hypothetical protein